MIELPDETKELARQLAARRGISIEDAVKRAVEESARIAGVATPGRRVRDRSPEAVARRRADIRRIAQEIAAMPLLDTRSPAEIMDDLNPL